MEKIQKIGVTACIFHERKVLVLKRSPKEKFLPGYWEMPGGKVEFGEDINEAVVREVKEETNLDVRVIEPYSAFSYVSDDGNRHTVDIQYLVEPVGNIDNLEITDAHEEARWIQREEINSLAISDSMKEVINRGFKKLSHFEY